MKAVLILLFLLAISLIVNYPWLLYIIIPGAIVWYIVAQSDNDVPHGRQENGKNNTKVQQGSLFKNINVNPQKRDYESDISSADLMSGIEFEQYCARVLKRNGYSQVELTPPSGDHGADIIAVKNGYKYAIQCKCYTGNVGAEAVQQVASAKQFYRASRAVVITNREFTRQAQLEAKELGVQLWSRETLKQMAASC